LIEMKWHLRPNFASKVGKLAKNEM
jgi:hypothetical protein